MENFRKVYQPPMGRPSYYHDLNYDQMMLGGIEVKLQKIYVDIFVHLIKNLL